MNLLLTGFEPFDGGTINPSWEAARALDGLRIGPALVHARRISCVFGRSLSELEAAIAQVRPQRIVCLGQAGGRGEITPERVAINIDDGRICDNAGCRPIDRPVVEGAPAAYFSTLPIKAMVRAMRDAGIPAAVSNTAGTFVCNHLFFGLMHRLAFATDPAVRGGFVHIPYLSEQAAELPGMPGLPLQAIVEGLRLALLAVSTVEHDLQEQGGALH
ncbi:MAG: pyroglutamyl-peptidase I [Comamonadaceae bacterium]|nr:MAG: pyroglutamyl-peptidase I [Comamonadaceae bacterium]